MVKNDNRRKIIILTMVLISLVFIYGLIYGNLFYHPFEEFNGPEYLPVGFNKTDNCTSDNEQIFEYHGNGTFWVGVIKNTSKLELENLINPFKDDPQDIKKTNKNIKINNHLVNFQVSEQQFEMDADSFSQLIQKLPGGQKVPKIDTPAVNINMAKFQAMWYCEESSLTYVATGLVTSEQMHEMEKMATSIKCHRPEKPWIIQITKLIKKLLKSLNPYE